jgi:hypothetical protein
MSINVRDLSWFVAGILSGIAAGFLLRAALTRLGERRTSGTMLKPALIIGAPIAVLAIVLFAWLVSPSAPTGSDAASTDATDHAAAAAAPQAAMPQGGMPQGGMPQAGAPQAAGSMNDVLPRLERRLAGQGGTDADWQLLAQTYDYLGRPEDAKGARAHHLPATLASPNPAASAADAMPLLPSAPASAPAGASADSAKLEGTVELGDALKAKVPAGLTLFIVAKAVDSPGPPVAVMRTTTSQWPLRFSLNDANAMVPGRNLSSASAVTLEARVSRSGMAAPQPGDFQSVVVTLNPHQHNSVRLLIDHVIG